MPMNRHNYPPDWAQISQREREAAGNKCRRCGVPNHGLVLRNPTDKDEWIVYIMADDCHYHITGAAIRLSDVRDWGLYVHVVLTVGHVDQDTQNNHPDNLRAWCQRCHLNHDRPFNIEKIRRKRAIAAGQFAMRL